jgi:two-component system, NtrC family, response regulator HydG
MSVTNALVVDDDLAVCRILHRMLSDEKYQVQISQSVTDALKAIEQKLFDVYVMDYKLPDGTGLDVAEQIRSKGSEAPIILISGYDPSTVAVRAEKLRISDIIEKPFSRATICTAVNKAIGLASISEKGDPKLASTNSAKSTATKKKSIPKGALVGTIIFLLLASVAIYYFTHGF